MKKMIQKIRNNIYLLLFLVTSFLTSCSQFKKGGGDTHRVGNVDFFVDESFRPLFTTSVDTFKGLNPKANINAIYEPEGIIINKFLNDSIKAICVSRNLTEEERLFLNKKKVNIQTDKIATDAIALIVNDLNIDTNISIENLKKILSGEIDTWQHFNTKINVVFDKTNSANYNYLRKLVQVDKFPLNVFAVESNQEVINYVKNNKSALGIIGLNWISDSDDPKAVNFMKGITVMGVSSKEGGEYFKPFSGYLYTKEYPLTREIWILNKGSRNGLHTGLVLFMKGEKGQIIVEKSALVPANAPIRLIEISTEE
jgi:phosphate transport system substrate-binding protein